MSKLEKKIRDQFLLWDTSTLGGVIPNCNYEPMITNLIDIFEDEKRLLKQKLEKALKPLLKIREKRLNDPF